MPELDTPMMDLLLDKPRSISMLGMLAAAGEVNMRTFTRLAGISPRNAQELREWMEANGLVQVRKAPYGPTDIIIGLTPFGLKAAAIFEETDSKLQQAKRKGARR